MPEDEEGWRKALTPEQQKKDTLFLCVVRNMAAALGMRVTYPAISASAAEGDRPAMPAFPQRTIDWSKTT